MHAPASSPPSPRLVHQWHEVQGLRIHSLAATEAGGTPFVLIHGLVISSTYLAPLARCLATASAVHAPDLPGFGASQPSSRPPSVRESAEFILQWMTVAGIARAHLVANSLGCQIIAHCGVLAPERVATLSMIGPTIDPAAHRLRTQLRRLLHDALHEPPRLWFLWARDFFRCGLRRALAATRAMFADYIERQLAALTVPTLLIRGQRDPTMPQAWGERALSQLAEGELVVIPQAPHCIHFSHPEEVARLVIAHALRSRDLT